MKIKLGNIIESIEVLRKIMNADLTIRLSYLIVKNVDEIEKEIKFYDTAKRQLIEKYGEKDEDGVTIKDENENVKIVDISGWSKEHGELLETEIDMNLRKIKEEEIMDCGCIIKPTEMKLISYMFE